MGNQMATAVGDNLTCFRDHEDQNAVSRGVAAGSGRDLDDAVLAATSMAIDHQNRLSQVLRLSFACKALPNLDTFTRTDGLAVLYEKKGRMWGMIGMTEVIMDNLDPSWVKCFDVQFKFEEQQVFKVVVYDVDSVDNLRNFAEHSLVGEVEFTLHEVVTARDQILAKNISASKKDAMIEIYGEEVNQNVAIEQGMFTPIITTTDFSLKGQVLFLIFYKQHVAESMPGRGNAKWTPVYKSEIKSTSSRSSPYTFSFNQFNLLVSDLCGEDLDKECKIETFISMKNGKHKNIGNAVFTINDLKNDLNSVFDISEKTQIYFKDLSFERRNSFLEYIFGGCELNLAVAIDYTLSNGDPRESDSLHCSNLNRNEYYRALKAVMDILQFYDTDKQFPVLGFGGKMRSGAPSLDNRASHCFAVNGNIFDPECDGIEGVLEAYKHSLKNVDLYGPTHFNQVIEMVNDMAEGNEVSQHNQKYQILLILTDGIINDMRQTIDQIVRGSYLPLSIIIVGVGDADFSSMDILDADDEPLYSNKYKHQQSDIVQFVPFSDFKNDPRLLAKEVLEEIPQQFLRYMNRHKIVPKHVSDQQRQAIKSKLTTQKSIKSESGIKEAPDFFKNLEEKFINQMTEMGVDYTVIKDLIEDKGLPEYSPDAFLEAMNAGDYYTNSLFKKPVAQNQYASQQFSYDYMDPMQSAPQGGKPIENQYQTGQTSFTYQEEKDLCKVCLAQVIDTVCIPCGHRCICLECSENMRKANKLVCPICRIDVQQVVKTYDA